MSTTIESLLAAPPSGRAHPVILDHTDYTAEVLLRGRTVPWLEPAAYVNYENQALGLLGSDVVLLDLGRFYREYLAGHAGLITAMGARSRTGYALKTMLNEPDVLAAQHELVAVLAKTVKRPLVVSIPGPAAWLATAHGVAGTGAAEDFDADDAENAAVYIADWLRWFADLPIAGLIVDDHWSGAGDLVQVALDDLTPLLNVVGHYRWALLHRTGESVAVRGTDVVGTIVDQDFWRDPSSPVPQGSFLFAHIPSDAVPETVLHQLDRLGRGA